MLGLRSTWREDSDTTLADLVFGTALRLPGQFVPNSGDGSAEVTDTFVKTLRDKMSSLSPVTQPHHSTPTSHVPSSLLSAEWVYMRHDAVRRPLQRPYDGPYKVITPGEKTFIINRGGVPYTVSIDRIKPAVLAPDLPPRDEEIPSLLRQSSSTPAASPSLKPPSRVPDFFTEEDFPPLHATKTASGRVSRPPTRLNL